MTKTTVFVCGAKKTPCSNLNCRNDADMACTFPLEGRRKGQVCGQPLCRADAAVSSICAPHRRLQEKRAAV